jgi:hypothetical protein
MDTVDGRRCRGRHHPRVARGARSRRDRAPRRLGPRGPDVHRWHDRRGQGRDDHARQLVAGGQGRSRGQLHPGDYAHDRPAAPVAFLRASRVGGRFARGGAGCRSTAAVVRSANFLELVQEHKVQVATVVPSIAADAARPSARGLRPVHPAPHRSGASPLAEEVVHAFERRVPRVEIREGYGLTETAALVSTNPPGRRRLGSVGRPVPGCEVRTVDDDGNDVPRGEPGEIVVRSLMVMPGYWESPDSTADAISVASTRTDTSTSSIARRTSSSEEVSTSIPATSRTCCWSTRPSPSRAWSASRTRYEARRCAAFVQLNPGHESTPDELIDFAKDRLGKHKYPRDVRIVDAVPLPPYSRWIASSSARCSDAERHESCA